MKSWAKELSKRFGRRKTVALDFDRRCLRVVHFDASRWGARFLALRSIAVPADVDMSDADAAGALVARVLGEMHLAGADVLMNVPRSQAVLKALTLPAGTPEAELAGMVQYQIANELPFDAAEAVVDFTITPHASAVARPEGAEHGLDVLAAAVRLPVVDFYRRMAEVAGLRPLRLCLRPASNLRCLDACITRRDGECLALVDVTADETEIDFIVGSSLVFSRSAPLAEPGSPAEALARPRVVQTVVTEVMRSLQSFQIGHRGDKPESVLVAGESELASEIVAALPHRLEARCERFDPAKALDLPAGSPASAFSAALGAAMTSADRPGFDFLHPRRPVVRADNRKTRVALMATTGAFALLLCVLGGYAWVSSRAQQATRMTTDAKAEKTLWDETVDPMGKRLRRLEDWQGKQVDWLGHLAQLSALLPGANDIYVSRLDGAGGKALSLTVHARQRDNIDHLEKLLDAKGYRNHPGNVTPRNDPKGLGYVFESIVQAALDANALVQSVGPVPARPADDASGDGAAAPAPTPAAEAQPAPPTAPAVTPVAMPPQPSPGASPQMAPTTPGPPPDPNARRQRRTRGRAPQ